MKFSWQPNDSQVKISSVLVFSTQHIHLFFLTLPPHLNLERDSGEDPKNIFLTNCNDSTQLIQVSSFPPQKKKKN